LSALPRTTLRGDTQQRLRTLIVDGRLPPGANVIERHLSAQLGVSRTPLREALLGLEAEGLLRAEPGRGFFVADLSVREARELYPLIATLESTAVESGRPAGVEPLASVNSRFRAAMTAESALIWDREWHEELLRQCDRPRTAAILEDLRTAAARYEFRFFSNAVAIAISAHQHTAILRSIRKTRYGDAAAVLRKNWQQGLRWVERSLRGGPADGRSAQ
jgi:DNA-binding GntR family transcriptional regulator